MIILKSLLITNYKLLHKIFQSTNNYWNESMLCSIAVSLSVNVITVKNGVEAIEFR